MSKTLPEKASLDWLKKTAKQKLRAWRAEGRDARLAEAQLAVARDYGFSSWRALKAALVGADDGSSAASETLPDGHVGPFLRAVGEGRMSDVQDMLEITPGLVNAVGPHPFWGGRPQALHVSIETKRQDMFDLLLATGADIDGDNRLYDHWSPVMLAVSWNQLQMQAKLIERGARIGLLEALLLGDDDLVERLLRPGLAAVPPDRPSGSILGLARTPFAIDRLLDIGASPEGTDRWGASAIETLSRLGPKGRPLVLQMMKRGLEAEPQEYARLGDRDALAALYEMKPEAVRSEAVLMGAVDFGHHDLVEWLLSRGANVNARATDASGQTALHSAAWNGDLRMTEILIAHGADISARDEEHNATPQTYAEVSIKVSNNPKCADVVAHLEKTHLEREKGASP